MKLFPNNALIKPKNTIIGTFRLMFLFSSLFIFFLNILHFINIAPIKIVFKLITYLTIIIISIKVIVIGNKSSLIGVIRSKALIEVI